MRTRKDGRTPATEVLLNTRHVADLIEQGQINQIREAIDNSLAPGSQSFEQTLFELWQNGTIDKDEALRNADSPTNLLWLMNNARAQPAAQSSAPLANVPRERVPTKRGVPSDNASFSQFHISLDETQT